MLGPLFTPDEAVQAALAGGLVVVALGQPLSGYVFVVDGVLIGAGDGPWLARAMVATLLAYLPVILGVHLAGDWLLEGGTTRGEVNAVVLAVDRLHRLHVGARHADVAAGAHRPLDGHRRLSRTPTAHGRRSPGCCDGGFCDGGHRTGGIRPRDRRRAAGSTRRGRRPAPATAR